MARGHQGPVKRGGPRGVGREREASGPGEAAAARGRGVTHARWWSSTLWEWRHFDAGGPLSLEVQRRRACRGTTPGAEVHGRLAEDGDEASPQQSIPQPTSRMFVGIRHREKHWIATAIRDACGGNEVAPSVDGGRADRDARELKGRSFGRRPVPEDRVGTCPAERDEKHGGVTHSPLTGEMSKARWAKAIKAGSSVVVSGGWP